MHGPINIKSPNNTSKWQMGSNSAFKWLKANSRSAVTDIVTQTRGINSFLLLVSLKGITQLCVV